MKKLILVKTNEYGYFIKNRFIVERDFDPDEFKKSEQVLFYENDKMTIQVIRTSVDYQIYILKNKKHSIKMDSYPCYTKAREEMFKIIKDIDDCEIYGIIPDPRTTYLECYSNEALIERHKLQLIN